MFKRHLVRVWIGIMLLSCMFLTGQEDWGQGPTPPGQPTSGPGGTGDYICDPDTGVFAWPPTGIAEEEYYDPSNSDLWWETFYPPDPNDPELPDSDCPYPLEGFIYAPACHSNPDPAPVVFFYHMGTADRRIHYEGFHRHLAAKGYIVIAPRYHCPPINNDLVDNDPKWTELFKQVDRDEHWQRRAIWGAIAGLDYYANETDENELRDHIDLTEHPIPDPMYDDQGRLVYGVVGQSIGTTMAVALANPKDWSSTPDPPPTRTEVIDDSWDDWNPKAVVLMNGGTVGDLLPRCPASSDYVYCCPSCYNPALLRFGTLNFLFGIFDIEVVNNYIGYLDDPDGWEPVENTCMYGEYTKQVGCETGDENCANGQHCHATDASFLTGKLSEIDYPPGRDPLWIVMSGEADWGVEETPQLQAYCRTTNIDKDNKVFLRVLSDTHGHPDLIASHQAAAGATLANLVFPDREDALDYYAYWKVVTAAMNCALRNQSEYCDYIRDPSPNLTYMGEWSDGKPVNEMQYNPRVRDNGCPECALPEDRPPQCYELGDHETPDTACYMVHRVNDVTGISDWKWRGIGIRANCAGNPGDPCYRDEDCQAGTTCFIPPDEVLGECQ